MAEGQKIVSSDVVEGEDVDVEVLLEKHSVVDSGATEIVESLGTIRAPARKVAGRRLLR